MNTFSSADKSVAQKFGTVLEIMLFPRQAEVADRVVRF
jgi:hypothetical protein